MPNYNYRATDPDQQSAVPGLTLCGALQMPGWRHMQLQDEFEYDGTASNEH